MENSLGKIVMYSLSSKLEINWDDLFDEAKRCGLPYDLIPMPVLSKRERNVLEIKELRRSIVKVMERNFGVSLRSNGGGMFIPQDNVKEWEVYEKIITSKKFEGIEITSIDIADTEDNKKKVIIALLNEVRDDFNQEICKLCGEKQEGANLKELVRMFLVFAQGNRIKVDAANNMLNRLIVVKDKVERYEEFLDIDLTYIIDNMDIAINGFSKVYEAKKRQRYIDTW